MLAWRFQDGRIERAQIAPPTPGPGQALLRPLLAGVCNTDVELLSGYYAFAGVAGHEFVAVVERAPDAPQWEGKRVVAEINIGCGGCATCLAGDARHCPTRRAIGIKGWDGAFAERLLAPIANLHRVPDKLPDRQAVFAEPLAAALEPSQQLHLKARHRLCVLGDGKLGLLSALALRQWCPGLLLIGRHAENLAKAAAQGVAVELTPAEASWPELAAKLGPFDVVVEATGRPEGINAALELVRPEGVVVAKTTSRLPSTINLARVVVDEIQIIGSRCGDMALALAQLAAGRLDVEPLIERVMAFDELPLAIEAARRGGAGKVLIDYS